MELNRNQYFMIGLVLLFIGIELRMVDSFVLNERSTRFLSEKFGDDASNAAAAPFMMIGAGNIHKVVHPPQWLGWCLISIGSVLVLHSLAMKKPGG